MESLLSLLECLLDTAYQTDILVNDNTKSEHILHGLPRVEFVDARLEVAECIEWAR